MCTEKDLSNKVIDALSSIQFIDVLNINDIQQLQDLFSDATGVASIITYPDGTPITKPSNFSRLCNDIIRKTEKGCLNCFQSDAIIGRYSPSGPIIQQCLSGGLWDAGASISVGGKHIANWMIGQVRNQECDEAQMLQYADEIGANKEDFIKCMKEIPIMSAKQLNKVAQMLFAFANQISENAYNNLQLKMRIVEQQKVKDALRTEISLSDAILESILNGILVVNLSGEVIKTNTKFASMWGIPKAILEVGNDKVLMESILNQLSDPDEFITIVNKLYKNPETKSTDIINFKDGRVFERISKPMYIDGVPKGRVWSFIDITERKRAEQLRIKSEKNYRSLFENMLNGFAYCKILFKDGQPVDFIYLDVNKSFESLTGLKNVKGKKVTDVIPGIRETDKILLDIYARVALTGKPEFFEMFVESLNDWYYLSVYSPEFEYFIAVFDVITKRKKGELELIKAKEKAEESDRLKSAFLANMSHEIRTPMNGILGFADLLKEQELSNEEQQEYIGIIKKSGVRMLNIINDLIDISKVESGQMEIIISTTNINDQIEYIYTFFKSEAEQKGIQLSFKNLLPSGASIIETDREKVFAILTNLVKNAIKYSDKGTIEIGYTFKHEHLVGKPSNEFVKGSNSEPVELLFFVKDTGIGIQQNKIEAIFNRFVQADITDKRANEGAGLGLSITKAYVEMLGGRIWVESEVGKGSTFYFTLPYNCKLKQKNTFNQIDSPKEKYSGFTKRKLLIVEDDFESELLLTEIVKNYFTEILYTRNGIEAIDICRMNPDIDLILMDIKLPQLNGYAVTRQIRQFNKEVVIIAQTAYGLKGDREEALKAGCNEYIAKPLNQILLMDLIKDVFEYQPI